MAQPGMLLAGEVGKPHGISGEVHVIRISDDPARFAPGGRLVHENGRRLVVESARPHRDRFLVKFEGIDTRNDAEGLRGPLYVPLEDARELEADEFWPHELTGCDVILVSGQNVGRISGVVPGAAQDLIEIETDAGARLVPLVKAIVTGVDLDSRLVVIDPPAGLVD